MITLVILALLACSDAPTISDFNEPSGKAVAGGKAGGKTIGKAGDLKFTPAGSQQGKAVEGIERGECDSIPTGAAPKESCVTADIQCGDTVKAHTIGGTKNFDTKFYESKQCWPATIDHDGGDERVYRLRLKPRQVAKLDLVTPCADLDLTAIKSNSAECPTPGTNIRVCDTYRKPGTQPETMQIYSHPERETTWYLLVEGVADQEGAFSLSVDCNVKG